MTNQVQGHDTIMAVSTKSMAQNYVKGFSRSSGRVCPSGMLESIHIQLFIWEPAGNKPTSYESYRSDRPETI